MNLAKGVEAAIRGHNQAEVARAIGVGQGRISEWKTGRAKPNLGQITEIEKATGRPPGFILRAAGYLSDVPGVVEAISMDPALSDTAREMLIAAYRSAVKAGRQDR